jgi:CheY-like chemotaxis protein
VDDVATNLDVARGMMKPYGMTVDCVDSGQAAIDAIRNEKVRYHAVFMDHMMPEMDGIEAVKHIRALDSEYAKTVPVIALTANAITGNDEVFLRSGFQAFLSKPIDIKQLNAAINTWVRDRVYEREHAAELAALEAETAGNAEAAREAKQSRTAAEGANAGTDSGGASLPEGPAIPGLDLSGALERFGGEEGLLATLRSYVTHTPGLLEKLRAVPPLAQYAIVVHGIKGASYGISADTVGRQAEELEKAARAGNGAFVAARTVDFIAAAEKLIAALHTFLEAAEARQAKPLREKPDPALLERIGAAAAAYDIGALDAAMTELEQYRYRTQADLIPWLRDRIDRSEFEEIQERLAGNL